MTPELFSFHGRIIYCIKPSWDDDEGKTHAVGELEKSPVTELPGNCYWLSSIGKSVACTEIGSTERT